MSIGQQLLDIMLKDDVFIPLEEWKGIVRSLDRAIEDKNIYWIERDNKTIGFATYKEKADKIFLNYCFIYKKFRGKYNLLSLRKFFRGIHNNFAWKSKRRNRLCFVK